MNPPTRRRTDRFTYRSTDWLAKDHARHTADQATVDALRPLCITDQRIAALAAVDRAEEGVARATGLRELATAHLLKVCGKTHG